MYDDIFIGVVSHKTAYFPDIPFHYPVCAGAYKNDIGTEGIMSGKTPFHDNTGDHISEKNGYYNELTAQYWMWKNVRADYIGLCHYRRYFNFGKDIGKAPRIGEAFPSGEKLFAKYGWDEQRIADTVRSADILVARETSRCGPDTNIGEFFASKGENSPLRLMGQCIAELYPEYVPYYERLLKKREISSFNMFIMKREWFSRYSEWLFRLEDLFERKWRERVGDHVGRACGEMAEYMLNVWLWYQAENTPGGGIL